jgi:hypothetical protein
LQKKFPLVANFAKFANPKRKEKKATNSVLRPELRCQASRNMAKKEYKMSCIEYAVYGITELETKKIVFIGYYIYD